MAQVIKQRMEMLGKGSPFLTLLAVILLLCSLYLLSHPLVAKVEQSSVRQNTPTAEKQQEHLVRVITLPEKKEVQPEMEKKPTASGAAVKTIAKGKKPAIDATFAMPVQDYLGIIKRTAGAKLILFDSQHGRVVGEVTGTQLSTGSTKLKGMSMRARDITADLPPAFRNKVLTQADGRFKPYKFLIVLPMRAEQQFERVLSEQITSLGISWQDISSIELRYEKAGIHINARIQSVNLKGQVTRIGKTVQVW